MSRVTPIVALVVLALLLWGLWPKGSAVVDGEGFSERREVRTVVVRGARRADASAPALIRRNGGDWQVSTALGEDGRIGVPFQPGSAPDDATYEIWIAPLSGGRYAWRRDVRFEDGKAVVEAEEGGSVRGRVLLPDGSPAPSVTAFLAGPIVSFGFPMPGTLPARWEEGDTFVIDGVPPGAWTVTAWGKTADEILCAGEVEASPGDEDLVIRLAPMR